MQTTTQTLDKLAERFERADKFETMTLLNTRATKGKKKRKIFPITQNKNDNSQTRAKQVAQSNSQAKLSWHLFFQPSMYVIQKRQ